MLARLARLVRFPAPLSALSDILAGVGLAGLELPPDRLASLLGASACLYAGGMALNDYADRERDAVRRPDRPIPSGEVSADGVWGVGVGLMAFGIGLAALVGAVPLLVALGVVLLVLAYDFALKADPVGLLGMGACRGGNILLGGSLALGAGGVWVGALGMFGYVVCLTGASLAEDADLPLAVRGFFLSGMLAALSSPFWAGARSPAALLVLVPAAGVLMFQWRALRSGSPGRFVKWGVLGIILLDAGFLLAVERSGLAVVCVGLYGVALLWPRPRID